MFNNFFIFAAALAFGLQQAQTPVFRGSTEVVVVDVQITDRSGAPLEGLTAEVSLKVDGKARTIASANFWRLGDRPATVKNEAFSTLASPNAVSAESYVLFVADPANMHTEPSRILFDQAADFMKALDPAHAVGLMVLPQRFLRHEFGVLRQPIAATLRSMTGGMMQPPAPPSGKRPAMDQIQTRSASLVTQTGLEAGIEALSRVDGRRTLVYFGDYFPEDRYLLDRVALAANLADVAIYVVASDSIVIPSVSERQPTPAPMLGGEFGGLEVLANSTGGKLFRRVVTGAIVLPQIARLLSAHYVLTFNVESSDKNGKSHKIDVKVNRQDVDVRFRKEFAR